MKIKSRIYFWFRQSGAKYLEQIKKIMKNVRNKKFWYLVLDTFWTATADILFSNGRLGTRPYL